jgi:RNA polymerase sigma factor (sigma-70 family)
VAHSKKGTAPAVPSPPADSPGEFEEFYRDEYRMLIKVALAAGATMDEAEDASNQTMLEIWRGWKKIDHPRAYARKAVVSNVYKQRKRDSRRTGLAIKGGHLTAGGDVDTQLVVWEDQQWVEQMLRGLPPAQQAVMRCVVDALSVAEISELLGKTPETIRKNLELARKRLRKQLGQEYEVKHGASPKPVTPKATEEAL